MKGPNLQEIHQLGLEATKAGREVLLHYFGRLSNVEEKHMQGLVSEADIESEKAIEAVLKAARPDIDVMGEEQSFIDDFNPDENTKSGRRWILDPLDGTTNYVHKFAAYSISLGLEWDGEIIYGLVDLPSLGCFYHAKKAEGAFKSHFKLTGEIVSQKLTVSQRDQMKDALVATGFAVSRPNVMEDQLEVFSRMVKKVRGVRRVGSAAIDLCLVAEGAYDAYFEQDLKPWDTAAGCIIVSEAGGKVTNYEGENYSPFMNSILAVNPKLHSQFVGELKN